MRCTMADMLTDLLIYIAIGIMTFAIGAILGYQLLIMYYTKRFMVDRPGMFRCRISDSYHR